MRKILFFLFLSAIYIFPASIILKRNIFTAPPPPPPPKIQTILKPSPLPSLDSFIEILGIVYFENNEEDSFVIIKNRKKNTEEIYKTGDMIEEAKIVKIEFDRVLFEYDNKIISVNFENKVFEGPLDITFKKRKEKEEIVKEEDQVDDREQKIFVNVDYKNVIEKLEEEGKELIGKVNIIPNLKENRVEGFKVFNIPEGSIPYQYGLRSGDIIRSVNGIIIDSIATAFRVYNEIKNSNVRTVTVEIIRNGQVITYTYNLSR
ncbi:MAG: hypothetical protein NC926_06835 [Candidatus Omnitrophica bacterium]|nr:hypothetical protein [Candidatus Omnitrophota bacterium]MCM8807640.1 hypothetical protein [Candidatus Omnitrophota bacterium]